MTANSAMATKADIAATVHLERLQEPTKDSGSDRALRLERRNAVEEDPILSWPATWPGGSARQKSA